MKLNLKSVRKWSRIIHRDLSFLFSGMLIIYAVSGIIMNHRDTINPNYIVTKQNFKITNLPNSQKDIDKAYVIALLNDVGEAGNYTTHYFSSENSLKVFLKGGSSYLLDTDSGEVSYERVKKRPIIGLMSRLHYNPGSWWTIFADIFGGALIVIVITGLFMVKGRKGLIGRGGIQLIVGVLIPLIFLFFF